MKKIIADEFIKIIPQKIDAHFSKGYDKDRTDKKGVGKYFFQLDVTAVKEVVYIPVSVASGRKSTGCIYQIEGTGEGSATASVDGRGDGVTTVTFGSITYAKIPPNKTISFKIVIEVIAPLKREYKVVIGRVNYKLNTSDARYKRLLTDISTKTLKFS